MPLYIIFFSRLVCQHFVLSSCRFLCLLPERQDAHAIVLSWSQPYWLSDVELIKDNLQGVSVPVRGIKSRWRSDRPLIIILLLVRMGEIITLQAQSEGTLSVYFSLYPRPQFPIFISSNSTLSFPLSLTHSLAHLPAMLPCADTRLGTNSNSVHILSLCTLTLPTNSDHHSIFSSQHLSTVCVRVCYWMHVIYVQHADLFVMHIKPF